MINIQVESSDHFQPENPEKKLLYALLRRAVLDYLGNDRVLREEAERWFFARSSEIDPEGYSFRWVCSQLEIVPEDFIRRLRAVSSLGEHAQLN